MRDSVIKTIEKEKIIVIVRGVEREKLLPLCHAMYEGGIRLLELTFDASGKVSDEETAENIKMSIPELDAAGNGAIVYGRDIVTGLPVEREIPTKLVISALEEHFNTIVDNVKVILERTPPELGADIYRNGIYLTGGASQVAHLADRLHDGTGLKVNVSENPVTGVALGLSKIIKDDNYKSVAYLEGMSR